RFATDAGMVSWVDMPVSSTPTAGTVMSYTAQIDGNNLLTVYSEADGSGSIENTGVGIGTTSPTAKLDVAGTEDRAQLRVRAFSAQTNTNPLIALSDSSGAELARIHADAATNIFVGYQAGAANN